MATTECDRWRNLRTDKSIRNAQESLAGSGLPHARLAEADDAVQKAWLKLNRSDTDDIRNIQGWLTTVVARVCVDMLRSRKSLREEPLDTQVVEPITNRDGTNPEQEALLADSGGITLLVVLDTLAPAERVALVLHAVFDLSFDEIASVLGRIPVAARQLASRARRRGRGGEKIPAADLKSQRAVVEAFLAALRSGDFEGLVAVLDPGVVVRTQTPGAPGAPREIRGAENWARGAIAYSRLARFNQPSLMEQWDSCWRRVTWTLIESPRL
jgi:RNA polymerase sigma-70 factor, ECF subfamily